MKVTDQHFVESAIINSDKKQIILLFNFPTNVNRLFLTNMVMLCDGKVLDNIFKYKNIRIRCVTKIRKCIYLRLKALPPVGSIFTVRIKNPKTQDYEDTSFLFDGKCFQKMLSNSK